MKRKIFVLLGLSMALGMSLSKVRADSAGIIRNSDMFDDSSVTEWNVQADQREAALEREKFISESENRIKDLKEEMDGIRSKADNSSDDKRNLIQQKVGQLEDLEKRIRSNLENIRRNKDSPWLSLKDEVNVDMDNLQKLASEIKNL